MQALQVLVQSRTDCITFALQTVLAVVDCGVDTPTYPLFDTSLASAPSFIGPLFFFLTASRTGLAGIL